MPLKLVRRKGSRLWHIHGTVAGTRVRESAGTADRRLAEEVRAQREAAIIRGRIHGPEAVATWPEAVASYLDVAQPKPNTMALLARITAHLGAAPLRTIDQRTIDRLCATVLRPGASPAGIRRFSDFRIPAGWTAPGCPGRNETGCVARGWHSGGGPDG